MFILKYLDPHGKNQCARFTGVLELEVAFPSYIFLFVLSGCKLIFLYPEFNTHVQCSQTYIVLTAK